ncbi:MAG: phosphoribosylformylglycinamidine synthase subunit PurQ [Planctomycetaceae bacterium]|nr:phosphoribosylformylglycinamidine synthase subunit PurQ [Planctomycetaceae bacterium]
MSTPRVCVLRAPGTNCDLETAFAFEQAGATADRLHLFRLLEEPERLSQYQILCVPGGFSYGDDLGAGVIFSRHLRGQLNDVMRKFLTADKLVLGICNGFQTILKAGLLMRRGIEDAAEKPFEDQVTLTWNSNGRYTDRWVRLKVTSSNSVFLRDLDEFDVPMAHAEGRIAVRTPELLDQMRANDSIALCYWSPAAVAEAATVGDATRISLLAEPDNPNGSIANIAGLSDATGRVLGLMPHPERFIFATQHPQWTRRNLRGEGDGMKIFRNAVSWFAD